MPWLYNITLASSWSVARNSRVEAWVIDRRPIGPLGSYVEEQDNRTACRPCEGDTRRGIPTRYALRLPDPVKQVYLSTHRTEFVDNYTLPGFLSWLMENGYSTVDMKHVVGLNQGFWVQYDEASGEEFRSSSAPPSRALQRPPSQRTSMQVSRPASRLAVRSGRRIATQPK